MKARLQAWGTRVQGFGGMIATDGFTIFFGSIFLGAGILTVLASIPVVLIWFVFGLAKKNFDPNVHIFSGWDQQAIDFGPAGPQFTTFTVAQPQVGTRILVFNPLTGNYGWIDATGVGPAGAPA